MPIKDIKKTALQICIAASVIVTGCHSSEQLMEPGLKANQQHHPEYMNNIASAGNLSNIRISNFESRPDRRELVPSVTNVLAWKYADMLGVIPQAITNFALYKFIDEWYGTRYRMGGNSKRGIDCSAFVQRLYEQVFCTNLVRTAFEQFNMANLVWSTDSLKEGDLVFFRTHGNRISHVGIYLMNKCFVHASSSRGVMISSLNEEYWSRFYAGAGPVNRENNF
jgi:cell wall-associated NlpC family hydrolase